MERVFQACEFFAADGTVGGECLYRTPLDAHMWGALVVEHRSGFCLVPLEDGQGGVAVAHGCLAEVFDAMIWRGVKTLREGRVFEDM